MCIQTRRVGGSVLIPGECFFSIAPLPDGVTQRMRVVLPDDQGPTLVHYSPQRKHRLRDT